MINLDTWISIISVVLGALGLGYAVMINREKSKLENLVRSGLRGLSGNICKVRQSTIWAYNHFHRIQVLVLQLP